MSMSFSREMLYDTSWKSMQNNEPSFRLFGEVRPLPMSDEEQHIMLLCPPACCHLRILRYSNRVSHSQLASACPSSYIHSGKQVGNLARESHCGTEKALTGPFLTLRSPLGMTPAMLDRELPAAAVPRPASGAEASPRQPPALTRRSYQQFSRTRRELLKTTSSQRLQSRAVDFRRVWWDKGLRNASKEGMSIWRPNPPAGYTPLGERNPSFCPY